ncbi:MAG: AAA family ATPase [Candidatus Aenigmatarchaeota archaeon]
MTPKEYKELLKIAYQSKTSLICLGEPGIGKTQIVFQTAEELGVDVCYVPFSTIVDRSDFRIPVPKHNTQEMVFYYTEELPKNGKGFILLDDITDADKYLIATAKSLLFERKLSKYNVPPGYTVVATGNPLEFGGLSNIDDKVKTRVITLYLQVDIDDWLEWGKDIHPVIRSFLRYKPDALYFRDGKTIIAPRNWEIFSNILKHAKNHTILKEPLGTLFPVFSNFVNAIKKMKDNVEKIKKVLNGDKVELPQEMSEKFVFLTAIHFYLKDKELKEKEIVNLMNFARNSELEDEYRIFFVKELCLLKPEIISHKEVILTIKELGGTI